MPLPLVQPQQADGRGSDPLIAEFDAHSRFAVRAARGQPAVGLDRLDRLDGAEVP